jgi:hypothetical protein
MRIEAGSHGVLESLPRLVDPASGTVYLRLVPHFLSRLHPPELRGDFVPCGGDPGARTSSLFSMGPVLWTSAFGAA